MPVNEQNLEIFDQFERSNPEILFNGAGDLIWSIDNNGDIISTNSAYRELVTSNVTAEGDLAFVPDFGDDPNNKWKTYYQRALAGESFSVKELIFDTQKQQNEYSLFSFVPMFNNHGHQIGATCCSKSINRETQGQIDVNTPNLALDNIVDPLHGSDRKYKYLFENNPCPMFIWDLKTLQILDCNEEAILKYGYTKNEFLGLTIRDLQVETDIPLIESFVAGEEYHDRINKQTWRHTDSNGKIMFMEVTGHLIEYNDRKVAFIQVTDLTEKEAALAQLKESQAKLRTATKIARLGYWQLRADGTDRYWSDEVYEIWGISRDTFVVTFDSFLNTIHPDDKEAFAKEQADFHSWKKRFDLEYRIILPDGSIKWVYEKGTLLEDENGNAIIFQGMVQDITEQKLLSLSLEESNQRYKYVTKATFVAVWDWDLIKGTLYRSEGYRNIFGHDVGSFQTDIYSPNQFIHPEDLDNVVKNIYAVIDGGETNWIAEYRYMKADGDYAYVIDRGHVIRDEKGNAIRMVGAMQDITQRKKEEVEIRQRAEELQLLNEELHVQSEELTSQAEHLQKLNDEIEAQKGYELEKALAQGKFEIAAEVMHDIGNAMVGFGAYINRINQSLGENQLDNANNLAVFLKSQQPIIASVMGEAKANALVTISEGIAKTQHDNHQDINRSITELNNIASHIQEILHIQRQYVKGDGSGVSQSRKRVDLIGLINDCHSMLLASFEKNGVIVTLNTAPGKYVIKGDHTKLMQVILNILKNSVEAFDFTSPDKSITINVQNIDSVIEITFTDKGKGFDEATARHLCERGFTTKKTGTGLGLYNCKTILESHGGTFNIMSPGVMQGAVTTLTFHHN